MKIIDANTGHVVKIGESFQNVDGTITVLKVNEGWLSARALVRIDFRQENWVDLAVRYMHPGFMFQKVAFILS